MNAWQWFVEACGYIFLAICGIYGCLAVFYLASEAREHRAENALASWLHRNDALQLSAFSDEASQVAELESLLSLE